ncbi:hypothetical protein ACO0K2_01390 [Undibacterium sp. MH2W]|uniref:hypothetical protein n=1 Tax=Undibacterium sp. MH2W TaxID=3413044 RepID=UPI003BF21053
MIVSIAINFALGPEGSGLLSALTENPIAQTAIAGFVSGTVATGNIKGGLQGAATAAAFFEVGDYLNGKGAFSGNAAPGEWSVQGVALHGVVGCASSVMAGSKCGSGFLSAAFSQAALPIKGNDVVSGTISSMVIGGTASVLGGGKFANGAETAAFGYLFNFLRHGQYISKEEGQLVVEEAAKWKGTAYKLVGPNSEIKEFGDCSGTTYKIYDAVGDPFEYKMARQFGAAADQEGFPFQRLGTNDARQLGDVLQFDGHVAIYAGQDSNGNDLMWTASTGHKQYELQQIKFFGKPVIGTFRYQVQDGH